MKSFRGSLFFIFVSSIGGLLLSLTGFSMGWVIGTLVTATFLAYLRPSWIKHSLSMKGIPKNWLNIGMYLLGIELGLKINLAVIDTFKEHFLIIVLTLVLSIIFSLLTGYWLWKSTSLSMMTSFISTTPGGLSVMASIADEVGANTAVVSIVQTMRVFLVIFTIPLILSFAVNQNVIAPANLSIAERNGELWWTLIILLVGAGGYYLGKLLRIPAPWLVGTMIGIAILQTVSATVTHHELVAWWPHIIFIMAQVIIGASIGSRINKEMFVGLRKIIGISFFATIVLIASMLLCSYIVSRLTGISFITAALAFAPGGIAEMSTASVLYQADSTFVVAVQVLRVIFVCVLLPPLFKLLNKKLEKSNPNL